MEYPKFIMKKVKEVQENVFEESLDNLIDLRTKNTEYLSELRTAGNLKYRGYYLPFWYDYKIVKDDTDTLVLVVLKKEKIL